MFYFYQLDVIKGAFLKISKTVIYYYWLCLSIKFDLIEFELLEHIIQERTRQDYSGNNLCV